MQTAMCWWATSRLSPHRWYTPPGHRTQPGPQRGSSGLPRTPRAPEHSWAVSAGDDARVGHPDEQAMLDHADRDLERCRHGLRVSDAALEHQVEDEVAVVGR